MSNEDDGDGNGDGDIRMVDDKPTTGIEALNSDSISSFSGLRRADGGNCRFNASNKDQDGIALVIGQSFGSS